MTKNILFPIYHLRDFNFFKKIAEEISDYKFYFLFFFDHDLKSLSKKKNIVIFFDIEETVIEDKKIEDEKLMHEHLTFETSLEDLRNKYKKYFSK